MRWRTCFRKGVSIVDTCIITWTRCADRGWDGWMASLIQWTWTWADSGRQRRTGKPGVLQSMGSRTAGHNLATDKQQVCKQIGTQQIVLKFLCVSLSLQAQQTLVYRQLLFHLHVNCLPLLEVPYHYPQHPLLSLPEGETFGYLDNLLNFPGSPLCIWYLSFCWIFCSSVSYQFNF